MDVVPCLIRHVEHFLIQSGLLVEQLRKVIRRHRTGTYWYLVFSVNYTSASTQQRRRT